MSQTQYAYTAQPVLDKHQSHISDVFAFFGKQVLVCLIQVDCLTEVATNTDFNVQLVLPCHMHPDIYTSPISTRHDTGRNYRQKKNLSYIACYMQFNVCAHMNRTNCRFSNNNPMNGIVRTCSILVRKEYRKSLDIKKNKENYTKAAITTKCRLLNDLQCFPQKISRSDRVSLTLGWQVIIRTLYMI